MSSLLQVRDLAVAFPADGGEVTAVRGISYSVEPGEVVAMVGESGSGKSVSAMAVVGLLPEYARVRGSVRLHDTELLGLSDGAMSRFRGKAVGMVFQDPMSALTPVYTVGDQIAEAIEVHQPRVGRGAARRRAVELLELVGIAQPQRRARAFPHELSGGERQRVVIAAAIANDPDLLICDEPTTALDVTVQAQILEVLKTARDITGAGVLIITHDLGVVAEFADRALVMYAGRVVESAGVHDLYRDRRMPYTVGLLGSVPRLDAAQGTRLVPIPGAPPSLVDLPPGCPFAPRCPLAIDECRSAEPELVSVGPEHRAACIRTEQVNGRSAADIYGIETAARAAESGDSPVVVRVRDLVKTFQLTKGVVLRRTIGEVRAVDGVSFELRQGRTLGIVGESGSGKSTTLQEILELVAPQSGSIEVLGSDVRTLSAADRRSLRRRPPGRVPGPGGLAGPAAAGLRADRRAVAGQRVRQGLHERAGRRTAGHRGAAPGRRDALPGGVLRGAKAAHRHRAGLGAAAQDPGARRTGVRPRRLHPGGNHQPAARPAGAIRVVLSVRLT